MPALRDRHDPPLGPLCSMTLTTRGDPPQMTSMAGVARATEHVCSELVFCRTCVVLLRHGDPPLPWRLFDLCCRPQCVLRDLKSTEFASKRSFRAARRSLTLCLPDIHFTYFHGRLANLACVKLFPHKCTRMTRRFLLVELWFCVMVKSSCPFT